MAAYSHLPAAAASLFSETHDVSPLTSPGNSQIRGEGPKSPVSDAPSRMVSNSSDSSMIVTDSTDDLAVSGPARFLRGPGHFQRVYDRNQHDPTIYDTQSPHVNPTVAPATAQGITRSPSPRSNLPEGRRRFLRITTHPPLGSGNPDGPRGEVGESRVFDSAAGIRVVLSGADSGSRDVAGPTRKVVDVQLAAGWEGTRDSTFSFSSSPFDEFRRDAGPSQGITEGETSTIPVPGHGSGSHPRPKFPGRGGMGDDRKAAFPRSGVRRVVPGWGTSEGECREKGKEGGDRSHLRIPTDHAPVSNEVEDQSRDWTLTPVSPTQQGMRFTTQDAVSILIRRSRPSPSFVEQLLTKFGVRKPPQLRPSLPSKRILAHTLGSASARSSTYDPEWFDLGIDG